MGEESQELGAALQLSFPGGKSRGDGRTSSPCMRLDPSPHRDAQSVQGSNSPSNAMPLLYLPFANGTLGPHRRTHTQGSLQHQRVSERAHLAKTPPRLYSLNLKCIIFSFPSVHVETHKSTIICL